MSEPRETERFDLDEDQIHFKYSNEPLINGIPMSQYFELKEKEQKENEQHSKV